jgi:hypothetical protein
MVSSSAITVAADSECFMCGGFSLGVTIRLENFEFIADYFDVLSLSTRRGDEGTTLMGSIHSGASTPWRAMIEDSAEDFLTASSGDGSFSLPSPQKAHRGGLAHSCHNHIMDGECFSHIGDDDGSPVDGGAAAGNQPLY